MAHYAVVDDFRAGVPQTILSAALRPRGIACHTTEGGEGETGAIGTLVTTLIGRPDRNASYHELWYPKAGGFEARRIVRPERASHSMNPARPTPWAPDARVRRILGDRWWDPNAASYAVSIAGSTGRTVPKLVTDAGFMAGARRRTAELERQFAASLSPDPLFNHGEGQTNRTDWGLLMRPAIHQEDDMNLDSVVGIVNRYYLVKANATARRTPAYNPHDGKGGQANAITVHDADHWRKAIFTIKGTPLIGPTGQVYSTDDTWWAGERDDGDGIVFYHIQDKGGARPIETVASGGVPKAEHDAAIEQIGALTKRIQLKDRHVAGYPKG